MSEVKKIVGNILRQEAFDKHFKCKLELNEALLKIQQENEELKKHGYVKRKCQKCPEYFITSLEKNWVLCKECGKMPHNKKQDRLVK